MVYPPPALLWTGAYHVDVLTRMDAVRRLCEEQLLSAGVPLPVQHRCAWAAYDRSAESWFVAVRDGDGRCRGGFAVRVTRSRALPGHLILRVPRFGHGIAVELQDVCVEALVALARRTARVLRVYVEVFALAEATRVAVAGRLRAAGFCPGLEAWSYTNTLLLDLTPTEEQILAALPAKTRRDIRAANKHAVAVRPIDDTTLVGRLAELHHETMRRTGGGSRDRDWAGCVELSRTSPAVSRLVGLFRTDVGGPESLLAFALGCHHGDHAQYEAAASTRRTDLKVPLAYPVMWDLLCWAKRHGASWFDFGGVTAGAMGSEDRLGGISDFKRYFSKVERQVGEEWALEPRWAQARLARMVSAGSAWLALVNTAFRGSRPAPTAL